MAPLWAGWWRLAVFGAQAGKVFLEEQKLGSGAVEAHFGQELELNCPLALVDIHLTAIKYVAFDFRRNDTQLKRFPLQGCAKAGAQSGLDRPVRRHGPIVSNSGPSKMLRRSLPAIARRWRDAVFSK